MRLAWFKSLPSSASAATNAQIEAAAQAMAQFAPDIVAAAG